MKKKIRIIALLLCVLICMPFALTGCGKDKKKFSERVDKVIFQISWLPNNLRDEDFALVKECGFDKVLLNVYQAGELDSELCVEIIEKCINIYVTKCHNIMGLVKTQNTRECGAKQI